MNSDLLSIALACIKNGVSIVPIDHKTKKPASSLLPKDENGKPTWKPYQREIADEATVRGWFDRGVKAIAVVCGKVSGGLLVLDFDVPDFYDRWLGPVGNLANDLPRQKTGGGRYQVLMRCESPGSNDKLAWTPDAAELTGRTIAIETRGEGGYAVIAPSLHPSGNQYAWISGSAVDVPTVPQEHAERMLAAARALDEAPMTRQEQEGVEAQARQSHRNTRRTPVQPSVIDAFNAVNPLEATLEKYGYVKGAHGRYIRPGGRSESISVQDGRSCHWSSNDPLNNGRGTGGCGCHDAFDVYAYFEHGGDVSKAVKAAAAMLGMKPTKSDAKTSGTRQGQSPSNTPTTAEDTTPDLPVIFLGTDEHRVVREVVEVLAGDPDIYYRGGVLVYVGRADPELNASAGAVGIPVIKQLRPEILRVRLTRLAGFAIEKKVKGETTLVPKHPPDWLYKAIAGAGEWPGMRYLAGVVRTPILRPDGSVLQQPGYDPATGVLYQPDREYPPVCPDPTPDDVGAAVEVLMEAVWDFRFESPEHRAAWLAGVLTLVARYAFAGPAPLFLMDANVRGAGKTLLAQTIGYIALGEELPTSSYSHDSAEMRKKITTAAIAGDRVVLLDNLAGDFGNDALDRALTGTRWKDRVLGLNKDVDLPLNMVWYGTGNNVVVAADTVRRIIHVRLEVSEEKPEERTGFKHPHLTAWLRENHPRLLAAALTILVAFFRAGKPKHAMQSFGSYEGWSDLVRQAVVFAGLPDPALTRVRMAAETDKTADALREFNRAWDGYARAKGLRHLVCAEVIAELYPTRRDETPKDPDSRALRAAIEELLDTPGGKSPTARELGNRLRGLRGRVMGGRRWVREEKSASGTVWRLEKIEAARSAAHDSGSPPTGGSSTVASTVTAASTVAAEG